MHVLNYSKMRLFYKLNFLLIIKIHRRDFFLLLGLSLWVTANVDVDDDGRDSTDNKYGTEEVCIVFNLILDELKDFFSMIFDV